MPEATTVELDAQYRQLREECGILDRSDRGKVLVSGPDAAEYLQGQLTNDVEALAEGEGCYAALLDRKGHLQSDMRVLRLSSGIWLDLEAAPTPTVLSHLRTYSIGREVEIEDVSDEWAILVADRAARGRAHQLRGPGAGARAALPALGGNRCHRGRGRARRST